MLLNTIKKQSLLIGSLAASNVHLFEIEDICDARAVGVIFLFEIRKHFWVLIFSPSTKPSPSTNEDVTHSPTEPTLHIPLKGNVLLKFPPSNIVMEEGSLCPTHSKNSLTLLTFLKEYYVCILYRKTE